MTKQHERQKYTITLDDDPTVRLLIEQATGMSSLPFSTVETLLARADRYAPVALFVDIHLGVDGCGLEAIPTLRMKWQCPIIVITSDDASDMIGQALAAGAHDFVRKPINDRELVARLLARIAEQSERLQLSVLTVGDISYSSKHRRLEKADQVYYLAPYEASVFEALVAANGMLLTKDELRRKVWGHIKVSDSALDKKVFTLRAALRELRSNVFVESEYGKGLYLVVTKAVGADLGKEAV